MDIIWSQTIYIMFRQFFGVVRLNITQVSELLDDMQQIMLYAHKVSM